MTRSTTGSRAGCRRVFNSVFPPTPLGSGLSANQSQKPKPKSRSKANYERSRSESVSAPIEVDRASTREAWLQAWQTATEFLTMTDGCVSVDKPDDWDEAVVRERWIRVPSSQAELDALAYVVDRAGGGSEKDVRVWFGMEARRHFLRNFRLPLVKVS